MSPRNKVLLGGGIAALLALILLPSTLFAILLILIVGIPAVAYLMLDSSQRRRVRGQARKRLGS
ncbi:MAG: hypothetical protein ABIS86_13535 [Streptosporangiaceae bacterium]